MAHLMQPSQYNCSNYVVFINDKENHKDCRSRNKKIYFIVKEELMPVFVDRPHRYLGEKEFLNCNFLYFVESGRKTYNLT